MFINFIENRVSDSDDKVKKKLLSPFSSQYS